MMRIEVHLNRRESLIKYGNQFNFNMRNLSLLTTQKDLQKVDEVWAYLGNHAFQENIAHNEMDPQKKLTILFQHNILDKFACLILIADLMKKPVEDILELRYKNLGK